jgi:gluconate 2-dehydrogenase gamma chain
MEIETKDAEFFNLIRAHAMQGFYGDPRHGGNRDEASWKMLGIPCPPVRGRLPYQRKAG